MADMRRVGRAVSRHDRNTLAEWVGALDGLANMTDEPIAEWVRRAGRRAGGRPQR
jgi:hypothetical protein